MTSECEHLHMLNDCIFSWTLTSLLCPRVSRDVWLSPFAFSLCSWGRECRTDLSNSQAWTITSFPWSALFQRYCACRHYVFKHVALLTLTDSYASLDDEHTSLTLDFMLKKEGVSNSCMTEIDRPWMSSLWLCQGTPPCSLRMAFSQMPTAHESQSSALHTSVHTAGGLGGNASGFLYLRLSKAQHHWGSQVLVLPLKPITKGSSVSFCFTFLFL